MTLVTPTWLQDLESNMKMVAEREFTALSAELWWSKITRVRPSTSRRELISWFLSTAKIEDLGVDGGNMTFEDMVARYVEYEARFAGRGLRLKKAQFEDTDGDGVDAATEWQMEMAGLSAYWPQKQIALLIKNGTAATSLAYDGKPFFATDHPVNPFKGGLTFANLFTGAASSTPSTDPNDALYPGACPIDESVTLDVALANLGKVIAYIRSQRMPNNEDPRGLRPAQIIGGPRLQQRIVQLTNAKTIAQAASAGGGSADVEAVIKSLGFVEPIIADEFATVDDGKAYGIGMKQMGTSQVGAFTYVEREPFKTRYYDGSIDADLGRRNELEWQHEGRNVAGYGHPYLFALCKSS